MSEMVSICIPTYQSEEFIVRTIKCATEQTHQNVQIIISVDKSSDGTASICYKHALNDSRIKVYEQDERLGWSKNVNFTLDKVDSPYFFIYFHDDIILPSYTEKLLNCLNKNPQAFSAHCDLLEFGMVDALKPSHSYQGDVYKRIIDFLTFQKGTTLRSLMRNNQHFKNIRFHTLPGDNHWAAYLFHLQILTSGPAIGLNETLYKRWQRKNSVTRSEGWQFDNMKQVIYSVDLAVNKAMILMQRFVRNEMHLASAKYALQLFRDKFIAQNYKRLRETKYYKLETILTNEDQTHLKKISDKEVQGWLRHSQKQLHKFNESITKIVTKV
jgi:glycosyltransferase involved in cell wall biosynthesis